MIAPTVFSRVKQANDFAGCGVPACNIRSLMAVAVSARKRQVIQGCLATMLCGQNVVDMESPGVCRFRGVAVFAAPVCAIPDASYEDLDSRGVGVARGLESRSAIRA